MAVFICYRRQDSLSPTGRIHDRLLIEFPDETVFRDIDSIPLGTNFKTHVRNEMEKANIFIAIIGKKWLKRRLKDPDDYVRVEIETALQLHIPIIPVLVEGASLPPAKKLPPSLRAMLDYNGMAVDSGSTFNHQMLQLTEGIKQTLENPTEPQRADSAASKHFSYMKIPFEGDNNQSIVTLRRLVSKFSFHSMKFIYISIAILILIIPGLYLFFSESFSHQSVANATDSISIENKKPSFVTPIHVVPFVKPSPPVVERDIIIHSPVDNVLVQIEDGTQQCIIKKGRCDLKQVPSREITLTVSKAGYKTDRIALSPDKMEIDIPALELAQWKGYIKTKPSAGAWVMNTKTSAILCRETPCPVIVSGSRIGLTIHHPNNAYCDKKIVLEPNNPNRTVALVRKANGDCGR